MRRAPRMCACGLRIAAGELCPCQRKRTAERQARADAQRPSARDRGYDARWEREAKAFLALPARRLCACGCGREADMVDHIIPHKGDQRRFWDRSNWQPMNRRCNSRKAARDEGGFGNSISAATGKKTKVNWTRALRQAAESLQREGGAQTKATRPRDHAPCLARTSPGFFSPGEEENSGGLE